MKILNFFAICLFLTLASSYIYQTHDLSNEQQKVVKDTYKWAMKKALNASSEKRENIVKKFNIKIAAALSAKQLTNYKNDEGKISRMLTSVLQQQTTK